MARANAGEGGHLGAGHVELADQAVPIVGEEEDAGAVEDGCRLDGAVGNDMSRGGSYSCTPGYTQYPWVGLQGSVPAAEILERAGYPAFEIQSQAIRRAFEYLWHVREATGDASWFDGRRGNEVIWLVNKEYGTNYLFRAVVALLGLGANLSEDAVYPRAKNDSDGGPLSGAPGPAWWGVK